MEETLIGRRRIEVRGGTFEATDQKGRARLEIDAKRRIIGRATGCDLVLADKEVSKMHLEVTATDMGVRIRDLSRNGTFLGEARIREAYLTKPATLRVGTTKLVFRPSAPEGRKLTAGASFGRLVGSTKEMLLLFEQLDLASPTDLSVLIGGETGTGKELVARAIHDASPRAHRPFVVIDCAAIPATLAESILFGHERGSFTGASEARLSPFVEAAGGTVFLDELGELPLEVQPKLLRVLAERQVRSVGSKTAEGRPIDVRLVAATRRDLLTECNAKTFRDDLFFRIAQVKVELPPLRERRADLRMLVARILEDIGDATAVERFTDESWERLGRHDWPGNVRELRNVVSVATAYSRGGPIDVGRVLGEPRQSAVAPEAANYQTFMHEHMDPLLRSYFTAHLRAEGGNVSKTALRVGLSRPTLRDHLKRLGISARDR